MMALRHLFIASAVIAIATCQTAKMTQADIAGILSSILKAQAPTGTTNQANINDVLKTILKRLQEKPPTTKPPVTPTKPMPTTVRTPPSNNNNLLMPLLATSGMDGMGAFAATTALAGGLGGSPSGMGMGGMGNYFAAKAFDASDATTNMMLFNGLTGNKGMRRPTMQPRPAPRPASVQRPSYQPMTNPMSAIGMGGAMGNYMTARLMDAGDAMTSMMLMKDLSGARRTTQNQQTTGQVQQPQQQMQQSYMPAFDPFLAGMFWS